WESGAGGSWEAGTNVRHHVCALCAWLQLEEDMAEVSMERHGHTKQLMVFFGAAGIGTQGGWGADAVLQACCKVVCWPRGKDQRQGRMVLVDEFCTSRLSSAVVVVVKQRRQGLGGYKPTPKDLQALPAKGKEHPELGYKQLRDEPPKAQQQQQQPTQPQHVQPDYQVRRAIIAKMQAAHEDVTMGYLLTCDQAEAREFIAGYARSPPSTVGGVLCTDLASRQEFSAVDTTTITFRPLPEETVDQVLAEGECLSCAGALQVEHALVAPYVERLEGSLDSVMGLSKQQVMQLLLQAAGQLAVKGKKGKGVDEPKQPTPKVPGPSGSSPAADPSGSNAAAGPSDNSSSNKGQPADIGSGLADERAFQFDPATQMGMGLDPGAIQAVSAASRVWDEDGCLPSFYKSKLTRSQVQHDNGLIQARRNSQRWNNNVKLELQHLAAATPAGTSLVAIQRQVAVTLATWDAVWGKYLHPKCHVSNPFKDVMRMCALCAMQLEEAAAMVSQQWWGTRMQLVVFFGNAGIGTRGGWRAKAVLQACRKVVERPNSGKPTDRVPGRVVTVDEFRTSRVSSI
ncbi:hypothetical protein QJQ45_014323, partial [Haematococcus lacustris]